MAVEEFGLKKGVFQQELGGYEAEIAVLDNLKTEIRWKNSDGKALKTEPSALKTAAPRELKNLKTQAAQIQKTLSGQRSRFDGLMISERVWEPAFFREKIWEHGLMRPLVERLIFEFETEKDVWRTALFDENGWLFSNGERAGEADIFEKSAGIRLWHPVRAATDETLFWRSFLIEKLIRQPFKQAFREIYLLTEAEIRTQSYSNRMAAHIVRQHQMRALGTERGWNSTLEGQWDSSAHFWRDLPEAGLRADFFVEGVDSGATEAGVLLYLSTDQVRLQRLGTLEIVDLIDVPPLVFSEIMRDCDLFVGVTSVGNDATWRDGGPQQHRQYWENYAFGELSGSAKTRRETLEKLLPRLKIASVSRLDDKFLRVKGRRREYKIHLGSGNILMEPNDQYLCIVAERGKAAADKIWLPFEGELKLAEILSKAFLLSEDWKITDPTITRQL